MEHSVMRYTFSLRHTPENQFCVTVIAAGSAGLSALATPMSAYYSNDESFLRLVDRANLAPDDYARLVYATMVAATDPSVAASCEEAELDMQQLNLLHLNVHQRNVA
jgi:hypothetical protein